METYILSAFGFVSMVAASLVKGKHMKLILFLSCVGNLLLGASYHVGGSGINGAVANYAGSIMCLVTYIFDSRQKKTPLWLLCIYMLIMVAINLAVGGIHLLSILVIAAGGAFTMGIVQPNGAKYRFWILVNLSLWCFYDILSASYAVLPVHIVQLGFTVAGMLIYDRKKLKMKE